MWVKVVKTVIFQPGDLSYMLLPVGGLVLPGFILQGQKLNELKSRGTTDELFPFYKHLS